MSVTDPIAEQNGIAVAAEKMLIGAVIRDPSNLDRLELCGMHFFQEDVGDVFELLTEMRNAGKPIDVTTIALALKTTPCRRTGASLFDSIGGSSTLGGWVSNTVEHNAPYYASEVFRMQQIRKLRADLSQGLRSLDSVNPDPVKIAAKIEATLQLVGGQTSSEISTFGEAASMALGESQAEVTHSLVVPYGHVEFDARMGGLYSSELTVIAARPGVGKSALGLGIALNATKRGKRVLFVACEMNRVQLAHRLLSMETGIAADRIRKNFITNEELAKLRAAEEKLHAFRGSIWGASSPTVAQIQARARFEQSTRGLDLLVIDYLGLLTASVKGSMYEKVTDLTVNLKKMTQSLDMPVIVLAQLNREAAKEDKPPRLDQLRDSGSVEQDASNVVFIHRMPGCPNATIVIAKQRNGDIGSFPMTFQKDKCLFEDVEGYEATA